jgi:hypothetical protein
MSLEALSAAVEELRRDLEEVLQQRYTGPRVADPPIRQPVHVTQDSDDPGYIANLLIGTATTGLIRYEWVAARDNLLIPPNSSSVRMWQPVSSYAPIRYQVDDAQNLIVRSFIQGQFEWLLLYEHDVLPPHDAIRRLHQHIREATAPVISGLYYTRNRPSEPLIYRGRGTNAYLDWEAGDLVWCDGVPTGFLLIHRTILECMYNDAETYLIQHPDGRRDEVRRVFNTPRDVYFDEYGNANSMTGTSDLDWCARVIDGGYFEKSGWSDFEGVEYPFLVDTNIMCYHMNNDGERFP